MDNVLREKTCEDTLFSGEFMVFDVHQGIELKSLSLHNFIYLIIITCYVLA